MCLWFSPALAFGIGIPRQRLTVGHLAPLQSLHERRTEMRVHAALSLFLSLSLHRDLSGASTIQPPTPPSSFFLTPSHFRDVSTSVTK